MQRIVDDHKNYMVRARPKCKMDGEILGHWSMSAVLNEQIQLPINIQDMRNKQTFDTYAFTINLVPLVLEETCFVGHTFEYK